jgi:hypothetical protein
MNGNVEAFAYQLAELITSYQFKFEFRVAFKKRPEPCSFQEMCKRAMHLHAQSAPHQCSFFHHRCHSLFDASQQRADLLVQPPSYIRNGDGARSSLQQSHSEASLEPRDGPGYT